MTDTLLVLNAGSSSVKFQLFALEDARLERRFKGRFSGIGTHPRLIVTDAEGVPVFRQDYAPTAVADVPAAMEVLKDWLGERLAGRLPIAVGHRVVHGGLQFDGPVLVDGDVLEELERYVPFAPLHQPSNLIPIKAIQELLPEIAQVACFDTAFHRGHGDLADRYALPEWLYDAGVRRYGFHGLSYEYIAGALHEVDSELANGRVIVAHLGSGASLCALKGGQSVDGTTGCTALDGLPMGTRPGQLDPGVVLHLFSELGMSPADVEHMLYHDCGLLGLSGISNDVRDLVASDDPRACLALDFFAYRAAKEIAGLVAVLGGLDALVFTAGIGENQPEVRHDICHRLAWLGVALDPEANARNAKRISSSGNRPAIYVIPTDEEWVIARHMIDVLKSAATPAAGSVTAKEMP